jgi:hypothetical protein
MARSHRQGCDFQSQPRLGSEPKCAASALGHDTLIRSSSKQIEITKSAWSRRTILFMWGTVGGTLWAGCSHHPRTHHWPLLPLHDPQRWFVRVSGRRVVACDIWQNLVRKSLKVDASPEAREAMRLRSEYRRARHQRLRYVDAHRPGGRCEACGYFQEWRVRCQRCKQDFGLAKGST